MNLKKNLLEELNVGGPNSETCLKQTIPIHTRPSHLNIVQLIRVPSGMSEHEMGQTLLLALTPLTHTKPS